MLRATPSVAFAHTAPPLQLLLREGAAFAYMRMAASFGSITSVTTQGSGQKIMVIPGFLASDRTTARMRRSLNSAGFDTHGWGLGRNMGVGPEIFSRLDEPMAEITSDGPVTLIGWSLGGLIAREYAKRSPARIAKVITMGSPFSGDPRSNNAWRLYELITGHKVDNPPLDLILNEKPPVPTIAFWSARDGVVASHSARGLVSESDEQIELDCTHMAFVAQPEAIDAVASAIIRPFQV